MAATWAAIGDPIAVTAPSDGLPLDLSWTAPAGCPTADAEREAIHRRVGSIDALRMTPPVSAQAEIQGTPTGGFQLSLRTRVGASAGERTLDGADCKQLADAAALVLALLINPDAALAPPPPAPVPPPAPPVAPAPAPMAEPHFAAGLDAVLGWRVLPGLAEGWGVRVLGQRGHLGAFVRAGGFFARHADAALLPGAGAAFHRLEGSAAACALTLPSRRLGGSVCAGAALVRVHGESSGVSGPGEATAYWPEALAELSGHLRLVRHVRLRLAVEAHGLGSPADFAILGLGSVYRPPATSVRAGLAVDVLF